MDKETSRVAEMALELFGSKMAVEFLREAWAAASPDAKRDIADAMVKHAAMRLEKSDDWDVRRIVEGTIAREVGVLLAPVSDAFRERIARALERVDSQFLEAQARVMVQAKVDASLSVVAKAIVEEMGSALRGFDIARRVGESVNPKVRTG